MSATGPEKTDDNPEAMLEEAAVLLMTLRDAGADGREARARVERWLAEDPRHAGAMAQAERLWDMTAAPAAKVARESDSAARRGAVPTAQPRRRGRALAIAAVAAAVAAHMLSPFPDHVMLRLHADHAAPLTERHQVTLEDGTFIDLDAGAAITAEIQPGSRTVTLLNGRAWFDVTTDSDRPFDVRAEFGSVRVVGTSFGVDLRSAAGLVSVTEGEVSVQGPTGQAVSLRGGEQIAMADAGRRDPKAFDVDAVTAWRRDQLVFYRAPLSEVVAQLNERRVGVILIPDKTTAAQPVSGAFSTKTPDASLDIIARTLDLQVIRISPLIVILR